MSEKTFVQFVRSTITHEQAKIDQFAKCVAGKFPLNALSWSLPVFRAAARVEVFNRVLNALTVKDGDATMDSVQGYALREMLVGAAHPQQSTSPASNLAKGEEVAAWAIIYEKLTAWERD